jgi:16S rRNA processing protein RimM
VREFFLLGKTLKSHGTSGDLRVMVADRLREYIQPGVYIFLDLDGSKVPFRISDTDDNQHLIITLEEVSSKQVSDKLTGIDIWLPREQVNARHLRSPANLKEKWIEYAILDELTKLSYKILRTEEYPQQLMAIVEIGDKEILIPLHEQLITSIDHGQKIIYMKLPEGLLGL